MSEAKTSYEPTETQYSQTNPQTNITTELLPVDAYVRQRDAAEDLRVVSWPSDKALADVEGYLLSVEWWVAPMIYIIDTGLDTTSRVSIW